MSSHGYIRHRRIGSAATRTAIAGLVVALMLALPSEVPASRTIAVEAARRLNVTDTAHLRYIPRLSEGATLVEEGMATGGLPGRMRAHLNVGATFGGTFTFYPRGGSISGHGTATPRGSGRYESFRGTLVVTGGTGRFAHARGKAGLYGVFDRQTFGLTVQTTGALYY
jgi:hypothetical protein